MGQKPFILRPQVGVVVTLHPEQRRTFQIRSFRQRDEHLEARRLFRSAGRVVQRRRVDFDQSFRGNRVGGD